SAETLTETISGSQSWGAAVAASPMAMVGGAGTVSGTLRRSRTAGDSYTLSASQNYTTDRGTVSGSDSYSRTSTDTTADHDAVSGATVAAGFSPLWPAVTFPGAAVNVDTPVTTAVSRTSDTSATTSTTTTAGYTWVNSQPTGSATANSSRDATVQATQT